MFGYLAYNSNDPPDSTEGTLTRMIVHLGLEPQTVHRFEFSDFRIDFFDTSNELQLFHDETCCLLLVGHPLDEETLREKVKASPDSTAAELVLRYYQQNNDSLSAIDGHISFVLYNSRTRSVTIMGDRFLRYSTVYRVSGGILISSHSTLLYPYIGKLRLNSDALRSSIHFRWLTGKERLFDGIKQALPGTLTHIDARGATRREPFFSPMFSRRKASPQTDCEHDVDKALDECLGKIAKRHDKIGVPLSGGVDSSLLLAKAREHFKECIAVSARFESGQNPELQNAIKTAKTLKVRHVITDIDDEYVRNFFPILVRLHEQPPRNYSDIALAKVLQTLSCEVDAFLYGEAADTYFGTSQVHHLLVVSKRTAFLRRWPRAIQKFVGGVVPSRPDRYGLMLLKRALSDGLDNLVHTDGNIPYHTNPERIFACSASPPVVSLAYDCPDFSTLPIYDRATIQSLATSVINHVENTGRLASYFGMDMYVPFVLNDVRSVGETLPLSLQKQDDVLKPVLRSLLCRYLDRDIVYSRKLGFPTPTCRWLEEPLHDRVARCREGNGHAKDYYSPDDIASLATSTDFPVLWYAICLDEIIAHAFSMVAG